MLYEEMQDKEIQEIYNTSICALNFSTLTCLQIFSPHMKGHTLQCIPNELMKKMTEEKDIVMMRKCEIDNYERLKRLTTCFTKSHLDK